MFPPYARVRGVCWLVFGAAWLAAAASASAQQQERKLIDRIMRPDMTMHAEGLDKPFAPAASSTEKKSFVTRLFGGGSREATPRGMSGSFRTMAFNSGRGEFASTSFSTRESPQASHASAGLSREFDTKAFAVHEYGASDRATPVRSFGESGREYVLEGKRQSDIDDLRRQKNLTVDQVREILNRKK